MEELIQFFDSIDPISPEGKNIMREHLFNSSLKKGKYFYREGEICNRIGFVTEGVLRVVRVDASGHETTRYFINEGHFSVDLESYNRKVPTLEFQVALTDCKLVIITRATMELFLIKIPNFGKIVNQVTEKALLEKYSIKSEMVTDDAITRYSKLMARNPNIIQRVPLQFISSYLGISPFTLSRIRKKYR
jgi:CRP-like cAMP-binding protein